MSPGYPAWIASIASSSPSKAQGAVEAKVVDTRDLHGAPFSAERPRKTAMPPCVDQTVIG
jgi:hypothetical protein